jgi:murein L,D-transpeptidase YafK
VIRTAPPRSSISGFVRLTALGLGFLAAAAPGQTPSITTTTAAAPAPDRILVLKSERKLLLLAGDTVVRSMDIALGLMPEGPKRREGDFRTPEGRYTIEEKKADSDFFLALRISYPNASDIAEARSLGVDPGGQIMIHGLPNKPRYLDATYSERDWTDGCIAVSNSDMVDLWRLIPVAMSIEIRP